MLRSIYRKISEAFKKNSRRQAPRRARPRRLTIESLECRKLLTTAAATMTYDSVSDGSFEAPALAYESYQVAPGSCPWQFTGPAGVSANGSAFTAGNPNAPAGSQVAFIKNGGSISQTVTLNPGLYDLSFFAAQRVYYQSVNQTIQVSIDGNVVGLITPQGNLNGPGIPPVNNYLVYETSNFQITAAGTHVVVFQGVSPSTADSTAFIDSVAITPVVDSLVDGGFEQPALPVNSYQPDLSGMAWQFSGTAGISRNGSDLATNWVVAQNAPQGVQTAYLQDAGSMSQTVYLDAGSYQLSFLACQREINQPSNEEFQVWIDPNTPNALNVGTINPVNTIYNTYTSSPFTIAAGVHTIEFLGMLNPLGSGNIAFVDVVSLSANGLNDGSFDTPILATATSQVAPPGSPWTFTGSAGIAQNGSGMTAGNPGAPSGGQVAFIAGNGGIGQTVNLIAGTYTVSFLAAQRGDAQPQAQQIEVLVDGTPEGVITPINPDYRLYTSSNFTVTAGSHLIQLVGMGQAGGVYTALIDEVTLTPANDEISDGGFETPVLANTYEFAPTGSSWQFSNQAGVTSNGSAINSANGRAPQGTQAAFVENNGSISQTVYLDANTYNLSFMAAQRAGQAQSQQIKVWLDFGQPDAQVIGLITPSVATAASISTNNYYAYTLYHTSTFTVAAGTPIVPGPHTIEFLGMTVSNPGSIAFIDAVNLAAVEDTFADGDFATPVLPAEGYAVAPAGSPWQFLGAAGVTTNASAFTYISNTAFNYIPDGTQAAFIKNGGSISQTIDLDAGTYSIAFAAAQRVAFQTQNQQIEVLVDGTPLIVITPVNSTITSTSSVTYYTYTAWQTPNFTVTTGAHTIEFLGMAPSSADSTAFIDGVAVSTGAAIDDGNFQQPALTAETFQADPNGESAWTFSGATGVATNGSAFTIGNPAAPDGYQVAFIKGTGNISQSVFMAPGVYNISYLAAQRNTYQSQYQELEVLVDSQPVGSAIPASPGTANNKYPAGTTYGLYATSNFTITTAGWHTIEFLGLNPTGGDNTALIDDVQLNV